MARSRSTMGRNYEDPYLNGIYGIYYTLGLQNGNTKYNKNYYDSHSLE